MAIAINILILFPILLPFLLSLIIFGFRKWLTGFSGELGAGIVIINIGFISGLITRLNSTTLKILYGIYNNSVGVEFGAPVGVQLRLDKISVLLMLCLNILMFFILAYESSSKRDKNYSPIYICVLLILLSGINGVIIAYDFFTLFLAWVVICLSVILLLIFTRQSDAMKEGGVRSYVTFGLSIIFLLFAVVLCYGIFGTLNFDYVFNNPVIFSIEKQENFKLLIYFVIALIIVSFGILAQLFLLNMWTPYTSIHSSTSSKAITSGILSTLATASMIRVLYGFFNPQNYQGVNFSLILTILGIITAFEGLFLIIYQLTLKQTETISLTKILIFTAIVNSGIIMVTLSLGNSMNVENVPLETIQNTIGYSYLHIINICTTLFLLFLTKEKFSQWRNSDNLNDLRGIGKALRLTSLAFIIGLLSNVGIIPTFGGITLFMMVSSLIQAGFLGFGITIIIISVILFICNLIVIKYILLDQPERGVVVGGLSEDLSFPTIVGFLISVAILLLGLVPSILANGMVEGALSMLP